MKMQSKPQVSKRGASRSRLLAVAERSAWAIGIVLSLLFVSASLHASLNARADVARFHEWQQADSSVDQSLWSDARREAYEESFADRPAVPEALLRIDKLDLEAPVWEGVDEVTLNRAIGRVPDTAEAGEAGNMVLAAHRDGFFRELGKLAPGDLIEVESVDERHVYRVQQTLIVSPDAVEVMESTGESELTLITCYPFYFVGPAPERFVVQATLEQS